MFIRGCVTRCYHWIYHTLCTPSIQRQLSDNIENDINIALAVAHKDIYVAGLKSVKVVSIKQFLIIRSFLPQQSSHIDCGTWQYTIISLDFGYKRSFSNKQ